MKGFRESRWFKLVWIVPAALALLAVVVLAARGIRALPDVQDFMRTYPGESELPEGAPVGFPAWLGWQHFLNSFFILLIIRTGWQIRNETRAPAYWTRRNSGPIRTKGTPKRISLTLWLHLTLDVLWIANGIIFFVLIFATGQWMRLVPVHWDVFPNAVSVGLQYASLEWPTENGWINYNALQLLAYFVTVFIAGPLAFITGIRMSPAWSGPLAKLSRVYPVEVARRIHFPVMLYFVAFIIAHVTLVLATGALRNLNHMYAGRDDGTWWGFGIFAVSLIVMIAAWVAARPVFLRPIASVMGTVSR